MDDLVKRLIKSEEDAKVLIAQSVLYKEHMKEQGLHDAQMSLQAIESENDQMIEDLKTQNKIRLESRQKSLEDELNEFKDALSKKDIDLLAEEVVNVVSSSK